MNELEEHRRAKEEEERRPIHRYEDARRQARARKELQERARKQEQAQEEAAVQARKAAIAEMSPSGTIPKAKFPHLLSTAHQRWDSGSTFLTKSVTTNKNTAAGGPCTGSPVSSFKNPNEIGFRKGESDHCSDISKVSWDPPYTYCAASMHSERKPLHLCKSEEEDSSTRGMEKKQLPHHSI
ncbi:expressed unknown protein (Partial), partial [Seminavis robusta]|eukprot:Sro403_g135550.1 n/a (181) ;mRNA; r:2-544